MLVPIQLSVGTTAVHESTSQALQDAGAALEQELPGGSRVSVGGQLFSQDPAGISITELPMTPSRLHALIQAARPAGRA